MKPSITIFLLFTVWSLTGQDYKASINDAFIRYKEAFLSDDLQSLLAMAHPEIVKKGGGSAYYIEELVAEINMYRSGGLELVDIQLHDIPKVIDTEKNIQAIVPYTRHLKKGDEHLKEQNFFLAISNDRGKQWFFTDLNKYDLNSIKLFIPNYNERLNIYVTSISH